MDRYELLTMQVFDALNQALADIETFVAVNDRMNIADKISTQLQAAGVTVPLPPAVKPRDLGPQTFGPAPGSDGDTRDWDTDDDQAGPDHSPGAANVLPDITCTFPGHCDGDTRDWDQGA